MTKNVLSAIVLIISIIFAVALWIVIFSIYNPVWFDVTAIFFLCMVTFIAACGIFLAAIILEKGGKHKHRHSQN